MIRKCLGCGVNLQSNDKEKLGYIKEDNREKLQI